jgi:hypothetical protein
MKLIDRLFAAPEGINPAIVMSERITEMAKGGHLDPERIRNLIPAIETAADQGERDLAGASAALKSLEDVGAIAAKEVPLGF